MRSHGPGVRFHPTDVELIMYYLKKKVTRRKFHRDGIRVLNVYNFAPWDLRGQARWKRDLKCYFFCPRARKYLTGKRMNRSTEHGFWKTTGNDREVRHKGQIVGMIKSLIFHTQNPKEGTNWVMHEYKLQHEYLKQLGLEEDKFVLCVIFEKEGPGPRNGAQYGGPYRDEDWDNDNDCDTDDDDADDELDNRGEDTNVVGALIQVHTDKGKSTIPNDFERADGYCVGSSSRTLPSDVDQSVNHGFPPTPVPGTLFIDSQLPLSDECGMFVHEILSASLENEQAQDIGVDGDISCEPSIPANEDKIYDNLEDFCILDDFADSDVGAHGCDCLANQNIQPNDYLEWADCMDVSGANQNIQPNDYLEWADCMDVSGANQNIQPNDYLEWTDCMDVSGPFVGSHDHDLNPHHQFAQVPVAFVGQSFGGNVTSLHGLQFAEDSVGLSVQGFEENESHMNQYYQTADGSIGFHGQEASMNGQVDHHFDGVGTTAPFGIVQPQQSMPRGSPHNPHD